MVIRTWVWVASGLSTITTSPERTGLAIAATAGATSGPPVQPENAFSTLAATRFGSTSPTTTTSEIFGPSCSRWKRTTSSRVKLETVAFRPWMSWPYGWSSPQTARTSARSASTEGSSRSFAKCASVRVFAEAISSSENAGEVTSSPRISTIASKCCEGAVIESWIRSSFALTPRLPPTNSIASLIASAERAVVPRRSSRAVKSASPSLPLGSAELPPGIASEIETRGSGPRCAATTERPVEVRDSVRGGSAMPCTAPRGDFGAI